MAQHVPVNVLAAEEEQKRSRSIEFAAPSEAPATLRPRAPMRARRCREVAQARARGLCERTQCVRVPCVVHGLLQLRVIALVERVVSPSAR